MLELGVVGACLLPPVSGGFAAAWRSPVESSQLPLAAGLSGSNLTASGTDSSNQKQSRSVRLLFYEYTWGQREGEETTPARKRKDAYWENMWRDLFSFNFRIQILGKGRAKSVNYPLTPLKMAWQHGKVGSYSRRNSHPIVLDIGYSPEAIIRQCDPKTSMFCGNLLMRIPMYWCRIWSSELLLKYCQSDSKVSELSTNLFYQRLKGGCQNPLAEHSHHPNISQFQPPMLK